MCTCVHPCAPLVHLLCTYCGHPRAPMCTFCAPMCTLCAPMCTSMCTHGHRYVHRYVHLYVHPWAPMGTCLRVRYRVNVLLADPCGNACYKHNAGTVTREPCKTTATPHVFLKFNVVRAKVHGVTMFKQAWFATSPNAEAIGGKMS